MIMSNFVSKSKKYSNTSALVTRRLTFNSRFITKKKIYFKINKNDMRKKH